MFFFDLLSKQSFVETWNQGFGYLPDLCACLNTHIGMVLKTFFWVFLLEMGGKGGPEAREGVIQELFRFHRAVSTCQGNNLKCRACSSCVWWNGLIHTLKHGLADVLRAAFVCLLIHYEETVQFMLFVPECCLAIEYIQYKMVFFPQENVQSIQSVDVSSNHQTFPTPKE